MTTFHLRTARRADDLSGRVAVVTGANRGIGRALTEALLDRGAKVWGVGRRSDDPAWAELSSRGRFRPWAADLGDQRALSDLSEAIACEDGALHLLVNNAAILGVRAFLQDAPASVDDEVLRINVGGPIRVTRALLPLLHRGTPSSVINLSSGVGRRGRAGWGAYAASKFAVEGLTQVWADEWQERIRCVALNPGATRTAMRAAAVPDEDPMTLPPPDHVCAALLALIGPDATTEAVSGRSFDAADAH